MKLFRLSIEDPDFPGWRYSTHRGPVIVRAESEDQARHLAGLAFGIMAPTVSGQETSHSPWNDSGVVKATPFEGEGFSAEGQEKVLSPRV